MNKEEFYEEVKKLGIEINNDQKNLLEKFYYILIEENKKMNLTRITEKDDVYLKHYYDSLTLLKEVDFQKIKTYCDVGTGAGFPGIVIKIVFPHLNVILIDSLLKRVNYLNDTIKKLNLIDIKAIHIRSEDYKGQFDLVTARAVASLEKLIPYCIHLVKLNGKMIAMKASVEKELEQSKNIFKKYHCRIEKENKFLLPKENSIRTLLVFSKY